MLDFFLSEWTITYYLSLSSFLHPLVMAAFELTINYYHGIADATKAVLVIQLHVLFGIFWNIPSPSIFGTDTIVWIWPPWKGCSSWKSKAKRDGNIRKIRILSRVNHIPTWRGFFASKKVIGRGKSRKIGIILFLTQMEGSSPFRPGHSSDLLSRQNT